MISINKFFVIFFTKRLKHFNKKLAEDALKKYNVKAKPKESPKLVKDWYKCGKCKKLIEIANLVFEYDKTHGRKTKCPHCKAKLYTFQNSGTFTYDEGGTLIKRKPVPAEVTIKLPKKA